MDGHEPSAWEERLLQNVQDRQPGFVADETVGRLAKWLRILGFDTRYVPDRSRRPGTMADTGKRILLTRSRYHYQNEKSIQVLRLNSDDVMQQVTEVLTALDLTIDTVEPCSRCIRCNVPTCVVAKASVFGKVPDYIWETQAEFYQCRQCQKIYWPGSHYQRIQAIIANILPAQKASDDN